MDVLIYTTAFAMILSKFLDCWTTQLKIKSPGNEKNILARGLMENYSTKKVIWGTFLLAGFIVALSTWMLLTYYPHPVYKILFICIGSFITIVQLAVAHHNFTGKPNPITRKIQKTRFYR